jgi:hypothetical protein
MYSGAVYSTMERTDYVPLLNVPSDAKQLSFKIEGENGEEQFLNKIELMQVNHLPGTNVLPDRHGNILCYNKLYSPVTASTNNHDDINPLLEQTDNRYYSFENSSNKNGFSDVTLSFNKPQNTTTAKLVIHGRNTYWAGLLHKEFLQLFGNGFEKWRERQEKADPKELEKWQTDQALPLMTYIKTAQGWKFIDYFPIVGNTATRDMIMKIDTKDVAGDQIELKLETAYRFWDLDFAAIDYSVDDAYTINVIQPQAVMKSDSTDQLASLMSSDQAYTRLTGNEYLSFNYALPPSPYNTIASYIIAGGGYYHTLEHLTGKPDYIELYRFKEPAAFDHFSRLKYQQAQDIVRKINAINR